MATSRRGATHLIKVAAEAGVGKRDHVKLDCDYPTADGTCIRHYIHISDLAAAHVAALEWLVKHPGENLMMNCAYGKAFRLSKCSTPSTARMALR